MTFSGLISQQAFVLLCGNFVCDFDDFDQQVLLRFDF